MTAAEATRAAAVECAAQGHLYATDVTGRGWCVRCGRLISRDTAGPAHGAITPAAPQQAEWVGMHDLEHIT